MESISTPATQI
jgi:Ca2+-binding EF-hand superfamily protein